MASVRLSNGRRLPFRTMVTAADSVRSASMLLLTRSSALVSSVCVPSLASWVATGAAAAAAWSSAAMALAGAKLAASMVPKSTGAILLWGMDVPFASRVPKRGRGRAADYERGGQAVQVQACYTLST